MKLSARQVSSPGRVDKFPPQPMRSPRSFASGSSRRGSRSRPGPIFMIRRTSAAASTADTKEPSSPKVTCMGQVRVRSKQGSRKKGDRPGRRDGCRWIPMGLSCRGLKGGGSWVRFSLFRHCVPSWPKWVSFFWFGRGSGSGKRGSGDKNVEFGHRSRGTVQENVQDDDDDDEDEEDDVMQRKANCLDSLPCTPPKNALILTRSRSTPYTSSSLACRFWGSPLDAERTARRMSLDQPPKPEHMRHGILGLMEECGQQKDTEYDKSYNGGHGTSLPVQDEDMAARSESGEDLITGDMESGADRPLMLTRCKSEPSQDSEKTTRLGTVNSGFACA
ncbi:hypothetical protein MLD38_016179 [Melastoma candidum]|uniref:Uncharacterized protein n=1 Tax=Melastoma candidum TaxID=119954 RepID=A0ACB9RS21_9MYRT|nr:hypothetical protein MLD38_016179 [Melastoma candidum]